MLPFYLGIHLCDGVQPHRAFSVDVWVHILSESSFPGCFLFRSRGVFHFLPALAQILVSLPSCPPAFWNLLCMTSCVGTQVCTQLLTQWVHTKAFLMVHLKSSLLCFGATFVRVCTNITWRLWGQRLIRKDIFPHDDVTACENPVTHQLLSAVCWNFSFSPSVDPFAVLPHSTPPTPPCGQAVLSDTSWEDTLGYVVRPPPSLMKQVCLQCIEMFAPLIYVLLFWPLHTLLAACLPCWYYTNYSFLGCFVIWPKWVSVFCFLFFY